MIGSCRPRCRQKLARSWFLEARPRCSRAASAYSFAACDSVFIRSGRRWCLCAQASDSPRSLSDLLICLPALRKPMVSMPSRSSAKDGEPCTLEFRNLLLKPISHKSSNLSARVPAVHTVERISLIIQWNVTAGYWSVLAACRHKHYQRAFFAGVRLPSIRMYANG